MASRAATWRCDGATGTAIFLGECVTVAAIPILHQTLAPHNAKGNAKHESLQGLPLLTLGR